MWVCSDVDAWSVDMGVDVGRCGWVAMICQ